MTERMFDTGPSWFSAGPVWLMNAIPGANFRARQYLIDSAGDRQEPTTQSNSYVGTLRDVFDVNLFNNVETFIGSSGAKTTSPLALTLNATIKWDGGGTPDGTAGGGSALNTATNWVGDVLPGTTDEALLDNSIVTTLPATLTTTGASLVFGDFIWNSNNSSTITINTGTATSRTITLSGGSASTAAVAAGGASGDLLLLGTNATTNTLTFSGNAGAGTGQLSLVLGASGNFDVKNSGSILNIGVVVGETGGSRSITKTGAGLLILGGANTFTGGFRINSGTVRAGSTTALGPAANASLTFGSGSTGKLQLFGFDTTVKDLNTNATVGTPIIENGTASLATLTVNTANTDTYAGVLQNGSAGTLALTKSGAGTLILGNGDANANTYSGVTTINGGELDLNKQAGTNAIAGNLTIGDGTGTDTVKLLAADQIANTSDVTINSSGVFNLNGNNETIDALNSSSATASILLGSGTLTVGANNETSFAYAGTSSGTGGLTKAGTGTFILSGTNNYTGSTSIKNGELLLGTTGSLASASTIHLGDTITNSPSAMFTFGSTSGGVTVANAMIVEKSASGTEGTRTILGLATSGNTNTYSGVITMNTNLLVQSAALGTTLTNGQGILLFQGGSIDIGTNTLTMNSNLRGNNADTYSIQGIVRINEAITSSQTTGGSILKDGSGTLIIQSTGNTYTGTDATALNANGTRIAGGVLGIFDDTSLGLAPSTGTNNVFFIAPTTNTNPDSIGPALRADASGITLAATRNINIANGITARFDSNGNTFTIAGVINGSGNLNKVGAGTLTLAGANTYTGTTLVSAGTLNAAANGALGSGVGGTAVGTSGITVNNGGTLMLSNSGATDRVRDDAPIVLGGGTGANPIFERSGSGVVSEGSGASRNGVTLSNTPTTAGLGALSLQSNATFNFGTIGVGTLVFGTFNANTNTLTILNWTSNASALAATSGVDGTDDRLIFSGSPTDIGFINFDGTPATFILLDTGFYEVVPVPETSTRVIATLALAAIGFMQRRRLRNYWLSVRGS
jgi:fibronectin-binding autotransporter adhesin